MAKILLVEDDADQGREYKIFLESADGGGHLVDWATYATAAVEKLGKHNYDLVLLDIMMAYEKEDYENPEIKDHEVDYGRKMGLYVYNKIRALPKPRPVAIVSVVRDVSVLADFPDVVGHLPKYFSLDDLGKSVKKWLRAR